MLQTPAFYHSSFRNFLSTSTSTILAELTLSYARSGFTEMQAEQALTWAADLNDLQEQLSLLISGNPSASECNNAAT